MSKTAWTTSMRSGHIRRNALGFSKRAYNISNVEKAAMRPPDVGTWTGFDRNGIQLRSNGLLYQLVTQYMTWFRHEGILLRSPLLDPGFDPIGTRGVDP